jgi:hypothetical protein
LLKTKKRKIRREADIVSDGQTKRQNKYNIESETDSEKKGRKIERVHGFWQVILIFS